MFSFKVADLLYDRNDQDVELIQHHCRFFAPHWGQQNLVTRFMDAVEQLPQEATVGVSGKGGNLRHPFLNFELRYKQVVVNCSFEIPLPDSDDKTPFLFIASAGAQQQGQGQMRELFPAMTGFGQSLGAHYASLCASSIGSYAWARFGFWPCHPQGRAMIAEKLGKALTEICDNPSDRDIIARVREGLGDNPRLIRDLFSVRQMMPYPSRDGAQSFAKWFLLSFAVWSGRFDLSQGSDDVAYACDYCRAAVRVR